MTMHEARHDEYSRFAATVAAIGSWWRRRRQAGSELADWSPVEAHLAKDIGLDRILEEPDGAKQLHQVIQALDIGDRPLQENPELLHMMERVCAECGHKLRCDYNLALGTAPDALGRYCPNEPVLRELGARQDRRV